MFTVYMLCERAYMLLSFEPNLIGSQMKTSQRAIHKIMWFHALEELCFGTHVRWIC